MGELPEALTGEVFERERKRLQRLARGLLYAEHDAEGAVQEAWLTLLRPGAEPPRSPQAWLTATVQRIARSRRREEARRRRREEESARSEREPGAAQVAGRLEVLRRVLDALEALDEPYRRTLVLRFLDDHPPRVIARKEGVPVATVRTRVRRGLAQLRGALDGEDDGARARFLAALAPIAGRAPWELGTAGGIAQAVTEVGGALVMKQKLGVALAVLVGALLVGGLGWRALRPAADEPRVESAALIPAPIERDADEPSFESSGDEGTQRELVTATIGDEFSVRGVVCLARRELLPDAPLVLRLHAGASTSGELLAEGRVRSDDAGAFAWVTPRPEGLATLAIEAAREGFYTDFGTRVLLGGDEAPQDLLVVVKPHDVRVVGRVLDEVGAPVAGAHVMTFHEEARTGTDGSFFLRHSSTSPSVQGRVATPGFALARFSLTLGGPGETRTQDIVLERAARLGGRVVDASGTPIADAEITSTGHRDCSVRSNAEGCFEVDWLALEDGSAWLRADATGFCEQSRAVTPEELAAGAFEWTLARGARVSGAVRDERGVGVAGARIVVGGSPNALHAIETFTDADGRFELPSLPEGETMLWSRRAGYAPCSLPIVVPPSGGSLQGVELALEAGHFLAGRIVDEDGAPVPFAHIYCDSRGQSGWVPRSDSDAEGRFRVDGLPSGVVVLGFLGDGFTRHEERFHELDRNDLLVRLERCGSIAGRVVDGLTDEPLRSFRVRFVPPSPRAGDTGLSGYWVAWSSDGPGAPFVGTDGYWSTAGAEQLTVGAVTGVEVLADGYTPTIVDRVIVTRAPDRDVLVFRMFAADARIEGRVVDMEGGAPIEGARVRAFRGSPNADPEDGDAVVTDAAGHFELAGRSLGSTSLVVDHPLWVRATDGPFELGPGQGCFRSIALGHGASVFGRLLDPDDRPLADEEIVLLVRDVQGAREHEQVLRTDATGAYRFENLLSGKYQLCWKRAYGEESGYARNELVVVTPEAREVQVDVKLRGRATVRGTLDAPSELSDGVLVNLHPVPPAMDDPDELLRFYVAHTQSRHASDGGFAFDYVTPGDYIVTASHGELSGRVEVRVPETGEVVVSISLSTAK